MLHFHCLFKQLIRIKKILVYDNTLSQAQAEGRSSLRLKKKGVCGRVNRCARSVLVRAAGHSQCSKGMLALFFAAAARGGRHLLELWSCDAAGRSEGGDRRDTSCPPRPRVFIQRKNVSRNFPVRLPVTERRGCQKEEKKSLRQLHPV